MRSVQNFSFHSSGNDMYKGIFLFSAVPKRIYGFEVTPKYQTNLPESESPELTRLLRRATVTKLVAEDSISKLLDRIQTTSPESETRKFTKQEPTCAHRKMENGKSVILGLGHDGEPARRGLEICSPPEVVRRGPDQGRQGSLDPLSLHTADPNQRVLHSRSAHVQPVRRI